MFNDRQPRPNGNTWGQPVSVQSTRTNPFNNDVSTRDTIADMRKLAHRYAGDPYVVWATMQALSAGARTQREMASAIFYWVRHNIRFVEDETLMYEEFGIQPEHLDKELLIVPPLLLSMPEPMGDCDDFSLLLAAMLLCAGMKPYWVTVAADQNDLRKFSHIYVCVRLEDEGTHMCLDAGNRMAMVAPGWEESKITRKAIWPV